MKPGQNLLNQELIDSSRQLSQDNVVPIVMIVESVQHLADFVEPIHKAIRCNSWCCFVGETDVSSNIFEAGTRHVLMEPEGGALKHADGLMRPPRISVVDPLET